MAIDGPLKLITISNSPDQLPKASAFGFPNTAPTMWALAQTLAIQEAKAYG
jgi:hypothetical protein